MEPATHSYTPTRSAAAPASPGRPSPRQHLPLALRFGLFVAAVIGAAVLGPRFVDRRPAAETTVPAWGRLSRARFHLEQPAEIIASTECVTGDPVWTLPEVRTPSQALGVFQRAGLEEEGARALLDATRCEAGVCRTTPPASLVESLPSAVRSRLYSELGRSSANPFHLFPFTRPAGEARWTELEAIVGAPLLARLEWQRGGQRMLSDFEVLCRAARSDEERTRLLEVISRMSATMVWITLREGDSIEAIERYWSRAARTRSLRPILEAMRDVPGGGQVDITHLLPPFARRRLNTFPRPGDPPRDCFWTALHFFDLTTPPDEFPGAEGIGPILERDYDPVPWDAREFGDLILFLDRRGTIFHASTHIAEDLVFTKNGYHPRRPWSIMPLDEVRDLYPEASELRVFRLRVLPER